MTDPTDAEVEAAAKIIFWESYSITHDENDQQWLASELKGAIRKVACAALTAAAQVRREKQGNLVQATTEPAESSRDHPGGIPLMPIYSATEDNSATEDTEDYGESVLGYRPSDKT